MISPATFSVDLFCFTLLNVLNILLFVLFQLVAYFAERLISRGTLLRNRVMQKRSFDQVHGTTDSKGNLIPVYHIVDLICV